MDDVVGDEAAVTTLTKLPPAAECEPAVGLSSPSPAASPEFEFWMVGKNPSSFQSPDLLTADELFSDGIVLPLRTLTQQPPSTDGDGDDAAADVEESSALPEVAGEVEATAASVGPAQTPDLPAVTFKWKDIFKATSGGGGGDRGKKVERRVSSVGGNGELININIWPFSRSRSAGAGAGAAALIRNKSNPNSNNTNATNAGNTAAAPANSAAAPVAAPARKVSSAPCSRSNSRGETSASAAPPPPPPSIATAACAATAAATTAPAPAPATSMLRRLVPGGHGRTTLAVTGIRLGRASPVWQLRRNKLQQQQADAVAAAGEQKPSTNAAGKKKAAAVATTTTTTQEEVDGDGEEKTTASVMTTTPAAAAAATAGCRNNAEAGGEEVNPPQGLFGLRTFFSKKVY